MNNNSKIPSLKELAAAKLPKILKETNTLMGLPAVLNLAKQVAMNCELEGRLYYQKTAPDPFDSHKRGLASVNLRLLTPVFNQERNLTRIRWDSVDVPEFWCEISFDNNFLSNARISGRGIPHDAFVSYWDDECFVRFDSKIYPEFWMQLTIELQK